MLSDTTILTLLTIVSDRGQSQCKLYKLRKEMGNMSKRQQPDQRADNS